jgi:hypothetical protein
MFHDRYIAMHSYAARQKYPDLELELLLRNLDWLGAVR